MKSFEKTLGAKKKTKPRQVDLYDIFCATLYVLKSGCRWDMIPSGFPQKSTVFYYVQTLTKSREGEGTLPEDVLKKIGRPMAYQQWKARIDGFLYHRRSERPKR